MWHTMPPEKNKNSMSHLFNQHFAAARSQWPKAFVNRRSRRTHHNSQPPASADENSHVYASVFFMPMEDNVLRSVRESFSSTTTTTKQASECYHANGTALVVRFQESPRKAASSSSIKYLLQPGRVGSSLQERVVKAGMEGINRVTLKLPVQVICFLAGVFDPDFCDFYPAFICAKKSSRSFRLS